MELVHGLKIILHMSDSSMQGLVVLIFLQNGEY